MTVRSLTGLILLLLASLACGHKPEAKGPARHYQLRGRVVSLNRKDQTASIDAAEIPGYMEAMKMDYPIASKAEFDALSAGESIKATVNVYESGDYDLSGIQKMDAGK
jgi:Copper binding periplasmic protein CusF